MLEKLCDVIDSQPLTRYQSEIILILELIARNQTQIMNG